MRLALLLALAGSPAAACTPVVPGHAREDIPIRVAADGSFVYGSDDDPVLFFMAGPARDIGGGRVGQVTEQGWCDDLSQTLIFADCTTGEGLAIEGIPPRVAEYGGPGDGRPVRRSALALQPPHGPLALTPATTVAEVAATAAREGWTVRTDLAAWAAERGPLNVFDPFAGCAIFYPGSPGAG